MVTKILIVNLLCLLIRVYVLNSEIKLQQYFSLFSFYFDHVLIACLLKNNIV